MALSWEEEYLFVEYLFINNKYLAWSLLKRIGQSYRVADLRRAGRPKSAYITILRSITTFASIASAATNPARRVPWFRKGAGWQDEWDRLMTQNK